ncbi:hypothetical protein MGYG_07751 [Nannizzia gypsea CBS 118893]|uniref:Uncharacterized protein n=1 Tax=Arthroderma gypseum (strain ATCC MYA-4604 / CBS 118893) TaxID=535722 RepID=E4V419_ARTGP|nr:hypothetical protein MGYG_07751 [Nannizzia gypsea CBS 118893]EFR04743.1 hypothetical protein MGYG_07751 [Nannizzia gypsea CBS 118893]
MFGYDLINLVSNVLLRDIDLTQPLVPSRNLKFNKQCMGLTSFDWDNRLRSKQAVLRRTPLDPPGQLWTILRSFYDLEGRLHHVHYDVTPGKDVSLLD